MSLKARLLQHIRASEPLSIAQFMMIALHDPRDGYYATRARLGEDFITAPMISQMFGELIGAWCVHEWRALGAPAPFHLIELGPGTGALMADALRAARGDPAFLNAAQIGLVETSGPLRQAQCDLLIPHHAIQHYDRLDDIPYGPSLILGNEFLDCFPIRQYVRQDGRWRERLVGAHPGEDALIFALSADPLPDGAGAPSTAAQDGAIAEVSVALPAIIAQIGARLNAHPGRALFIDYGVGGGGDTLQAVRGHQKIDPLEAPGECDLTAHVDFAAIGALARAQSLSVHGPAPQGAWLRSLGLDQRAHALVSANPGAHETIAAACDRLTSTSQMGDLFNVICLSHFDSPAPAGFWT